MEKTILLITPLEDRKLHLTAYFVYDKHLYACLPVAHLLTKLDTIFSDVFENVTIHGCYFGFINYIAPLMMDPFRSQCNYVSDVDQCPCI